MDNFPDLNEECKDSQIVFHRHSLLHVDQAIFRATEAKYGELAQTPDDRQAPLPRCVGNLKLDEETSEINGAMHVNPAKPSFLCTSHGVWWWQLAFTNHTYQVIPPLYTIIHSLDFNEGELATTNG